ncbi:hypothetical protein IAR55_001458 [Kwoniella newhampshirensis]|uniref:Cyclin N-terminal domain-containing protein n=1 Tax=Kwoniella newhampshirensis TaxID=1651941 RepID=A0AAW0Z274_9TREE
MPYMYDMPTGRGTSADRARAVEAEYTGSEVELLKLLNGGYQQLSPFSEARGHGRAAEDEDSDVSQEQVQVTSPQVLILNPVPPCQSKTPSLDSHTYHTTTPFRCPPFICDLLRLRETPTLHLQEDYLLHKRYSRMSFNGRPYPPVPPDASTLSRPIDDWIHREKTLAPVGAMRVQDPMAQYYRDRQQSDPAPLVSSGNAYAYHHDPVPDALPGFSRQQQHSVWSPPRQAWLNFQPTEFRAPILHPRLVQLPERPITPHDTYRYPASHVDYTYVAPAIPEVSAESVNAAFAMWYAGQVIDVLVTPGQYRPGVGGAADELWGPRGREKDAWLRVGRSPPDYSKPWGRMGMTQTPVPKPRTVLHRRPELEVQDPWNVSCSRRNKPSPDFVSFILDTIQRMTISPTALVAAVWYLNGLGLHEGDGPKGAELREFLREYRLYEPEAVERRVATLGLILAGKWLDDNSFLTKSWCEVTTIPIKQIDRMERCALMDLHFSLFVPVSSWVDHVNKLYTALISKLLSDEVDHIVIPFIDQMVTDARDTELEDPLSVSSSPNYERRLSAEELPAAADQAISRDWGSFARPYVHVPNASAVWEGRDAEVDVEMERAERSVDALVNDEDWEVEEEEEEEFLDYDGAKRWLPPVSELKRSTSNSSDRSHGSANSQHHIATYPSQTNLEALDDCESFSRHRSSSEWSSVSSKPLKTFEWRSSDAFGYDQRVACCQRCDSQKSASKRSPLGALGHPNIGHPIEPGISIVRAPTQQYEPLSEFGHMGGNASSYLRINRWGASASRW